MIFHKYKINNQNINTDFIDLILKLHDLEYKDLIINNDTIVIPGITRDILDKWKDELISIFKEIGLSVQIESDYVNSDEPSQVFDISKMRKNLNKINISPNLINLKKNIPIILPVFNGCIAKAQNKREYMEDMTSVLTFNDIKIFSVFDGHGGDTVSNILSKKLPIVLAKTIYKYKKDNNIQNIIKKTFIKFDEVLYNLIYPKLRNVGSTAVIVMKHNNDLYIAHAGDSRAILFTLNPDMIIYQTKDHSPDEQSEQDRIRRAGGDIYENRGTIRIKQTGTNVSRSFGDFVGKVKRLSNKQKKEFYKDVDYAKKNSVYLKENAIVSVEPDVKHIKLQKNLVYYVLLASDGLIIKDYKSNSMNILKYLKNNGMLSGCKNIMNNVIIKKHSRDNVSIILVKL